LLTDTGVFEPGRVAQYLHQDLPHDAHEAYGRLQPSMPLTIVVDS